MKAGLDTVTSQLSLSFWELARRKTIRNRLSHDPSLIPGAVEELLRFFSIVTVSRLCIADVEVGGQLVRAGQMVQVLLPATGRDAEEFSEPADIELPRPSNHHLAFGAGVHRCVGAHLGRLELRIALEELLQQMPEYGLTLEVEPSWDWGVIIGISELPVTVSPEDSHVASETA